jgi:hypothetical protein
MGAAKTTTSTEGRDLILEEVSSARLRGYCLRHDTWQLQLSSSR